MGLAVPRVAGRHAIRTRVGHLLVAGCETNRGRLEELIKRAETVAPIRQAECGGPVGAPAIRGYGPALCGLGWAAGVRLAGQDAEHRDVGRLFDVGFRAPLVDGDQAGGLDVEAGEPCADLVGVARDEWHAG
jgi:hypothetical protein